MFYGPPGTGKTTTIINLIRDYQAKYNQNANGTHPFSGNGTIIHLNASDERGIDIIRNQIYQFVKSKSLFETGLKFVILDEVDYMTKNAQQALKYLLQSSLYNVRFCLICNYISKIDESLKNEFVSIRFNQLPNREIFQFLKNVAEKESVKLSDTAIQTIQTLYQSDIRSMINFIQLNRAKNIETMVMTNDIYKTIYEMSLRCIRNDNAQSKPENIIQYIHEISIQYNTDKRTIINRFFNYMIRNYKVTSEFLSFAETVVHSHALAMRHHRSQEVDDSLIEVRIFL
jgi:replication factor C subunit 3/5